MNTTTKLLRDCDDLIATIEAAKKLITDNAWHFDEFGESSSFGSSLDLAFYLHEPPQDSKPFCRAVGGVWKRETDGGRIDYRRNGELPIIIFGAEPPQIPEPLFV